MYRWLRREEEEWWGRRQVMRLAGPADHPIDPSLQSNHHHRQQQAGPGCGRCSRQQVDNITQPLSRISTEEKLLRLPAYANLKMFIPQFES